MRTFKSYSIILLLCAGLPLLSCNREFIPEEGKKGDECQSSVFPISVLPYDADTKSVLSVPDIETRVTCVSYAAYTGGHLFCAGHKEENLSSFAADLLPGLSYNIYVLANMGSLAPEFPESESEVSSMKYTVILYYVGGMAQSDNSVYSLGIPMAGKILGFVPGSGSNTVTLEKLFAKITVNATIDGWNGVLSSMSLYNLNRTLKPFGVSRADSYSDIYLGSGDSVISLSDTESVLPISPSASVVLYLPENMQGTIAGIASSSEKRPDGGSSSVFSKKDLLSYLSVVAYGNGSDCSGHMIYQSYLGNNATDNFDVQRNTHYVWNLTYGRDGIKEDDWKHSNNLTWNDYSLSLSPSGHVRMIVGESRQFTAILMTDHWVNGSISSSDSQFLSSGVTWSSSDTSVAVVNNAGMVSIPDGTGGVVDITAQFTAPDGRILSASTTVAVSYWDDSWDEGGEINL